MKITPPTELPDVLLVEPDVHRDARGFLLETWHTARYAEAGREADFGQHNHSHSHHGTWRGLHIQISKRRGKLIQVSAGEVFDLAELQSKCSEVYDATSELTIAWEDPTIGIQWPLKTPLLFDKDRLGCSLADCAPTDLRVYSTRGGPDE